jgi:hypothetical protein
LPDGLFSNQKYQFGKIEEYLVMESVGIMSLDLWQCGIFFIAIWYILGVVPPFGMLYQKNLSTLVFKNHNIGPWWVLCNLLDVLFYFHFFVEKFWRH